MARKMHFIGAQAYADGTGLESLNIVFPNIYGPGDHFDPIRSHALGALIAKIVNAKRSDDPEVIIWGTGTPVREWMYIDDAASAMAKCLDAPPYRDLINVGTGQGVSILETAQVIQRLVGYEGKLVCDTSRPDGAPHKTLDGSRGTSLLEFVPQHDFESGVRETIAWYLTRYSETRSE
jgi:GDP-L-fucose synthase